jgi:hypothetical protein
VNQDGTIAALDFLCYAAGCALFLFAFAAVGRLIMGAIK